MMSQTEKTPVARLHLRNGFLAEILIAAAVAALLFVLFTLVMGEPRIFSIAASLLAGLLICSAAVLIFREGSFIRGACATIACYIKEPLPESAQTPEELYESFHRAFLQAETVELRYKKLIGIIEMLQRNEPFQTILDNIFVSFKEYLPYTHIGIALIDRDTHKIRASFAASNEKHAALRKQLLGFETDINSTSLGKLLRSGEPRLINDLEAYQHGHEPHAYNRILLNAGIRSSISYPLIKSGQPVGIIFFSSDHPNAYSEVNTEFLHTLANSLMFSLEKDILADEMVVSTTLALAMLTEEHSPETGDHLTRMKKYSRLVAEVLSNDERYSETVDLQYVNKIERFSPLHDIGKVAIPDDVLNKPGKLTPAEFEIMKKHALYGGTVLRQANENISKYGKSIFEMGIEIVEGHHEWWDGSGYPHGYAGEQIPLSARIVAVADVFDALTSVRVYKKAMSPEKALEIIKSESGSHFDPTIVEIFEHNYDKFRQLYFEYQAAGHNGSQTQE